MRERKEPKTKPNTFEATPCVCVRMRGRALVLAFGEWYSKQKTMFCVLSGGVSGEHWVQCYKPEDAARIEAWAKKWLEKNGPDKLAEDEDRIAYR